MKATRWMACALFLVVALDGCTDNRQSFFIRHIGIPSEGECEVPADRSAASLPAGMLDLAYKQSYVISPLLENAMESSTALNPLTAESNRITVTGAQVRLSTEAGESLGGGDFFVPMSKTIDPGGLSSMSFVAIPEGYLTGVSTGQMVIIEMKVLGISGGALEVDTPWFAFPVYTCDGCLASWPDTADYNTAGACYDCTTATAAAGEDPCNDGQDRGEYNCCFTLSPFCLDRRC